MTVAILFARTDSIYKTLAGCDVFDIERDALTWRGGSPVVAHPPCRSWSRLRHRAKPRAGERELAIWAVQQVRQWGGVLEHPAASALWSACGLPAAGEGADEFGGWTLGVDQFWWGHRARKRSLFYIVGCAPRSVPALPLRLGVPAFRIGFSSPGNPDLPKREREATPEDLARWLVDLAGRCFVNRRAAA